MAYRDRRYPEYAQTPFGPAIPGSIAADVVAREAAKAGGADFWDKHNAMARELEQRQYMADMERRAKLADDTERNRTGLNGVTAMLGDPFSQAYEYRFPDASGEYKTADALGHGIDITVGGLDGSAPPPLPTVRPRLGMGKRFVKPEYEGALGNLGTPRMRPTSDLQLLEDQKLQNRLAYNKANVDGKKELQSTSLGANAAMRGASIEANDPTNIGKSGEIVQEMKRSVDAVRSPASNAHQDALKVEVGPRSGDAPTVEQFAVVYRRKNPNATPEEIQAEYNRRLGVQ